MQGRFYFYINVIDHMVSFLICCNHGNSTSRLAPHKNIVRHVEFDKYY
jgi:hypothetical protein